MDKNNEKPAVVKPYALNPTSDRVGKKKPAPIKTHLKKTRLSVGFLGFFLVFFPHDQNGISKRHWINLEVCMNVLIPGWGHVLNTLKFRATSPNKRLNEEDDHIPPSLVFSVKCKYYDCRKANCLLSVLAICKVSSVWRIPRKV